MYVCTLNRNREGNSNWGGPKLELSASAYPMSLRQPLCLSHYPCSVPRVTWWYFQAVLELQGHLLVFFFSLFGAEVLPLRVTSPSTRRPFDMPGLLPILIEGSSPVHPRLMISVKGNLNSSSSLLPSIYQSCVIRIPT